MKRNVTRRWITFLLILCILSLSFLSGCAEPTVHYNSYIDSASFAMDVVEQLRESPYKPTLKNYEFWTYSNANIAPNENAAPELSVTVGELQITGEYVGASAEYGLSSYRDRYKGEKYTFAVHPGNGQVVSFGIRGEEEYYKALCALPDLDDPEEDSRRIAQNIAKDYINVSEYRVQRFGKVPHSVDVDGQEQKIIVYTYYFVRYFDDIPSSDYMEISVTSKGTLHGMYAGDIGTLKGVEFDLAAVDKSINSGIEEELGKHNFRLLGTEAVSRKVRLTLDKQPAVFTLVRVSVQDSFGEEQDGYIETVTLFSTDPNKAVATRPLPTYGNDETAVP